MISSFTVGNSMCIHWACFALLYFKSRDLVLVLSLLDSQSPTSTTSTTMARPSFQTKHSVRNIVDLLKRRRTKNATRSVPTTAQATSSPAAKPTSTFTLFFELPAELREIVYEYYFVETRIGVGSHPRDRYGTALLFVSKQVHEEALPILYRCGTLTLDLSPKYWKELPTYEYFLDHCSIQLGSFYRGEVSQLNKFSNIHLTISRPPPASSAPRGPLDALLHRTRPATSWWQQVLIIYVTATRYPGIQGSTFTVAINYGDLTLTGPETLPTFATEAWRYTRGWRDVVREWREARVDKLSIEDRWALGWGSANLSPDPNAREFKAMTTIWSCLGESADVMGTKLRVENSDCTKGATLMTDKLPELVESARALVEGEENKDVWLVLELGVKVDEHEGEAGEKSEE